MINPETTDKKPNKCCADNLEYDYGDAVEWEVWNCSVCDEHYVVDIEIVRDYKNMQQIKRNWK